MKLPRIVVLGTALAMVAAGAFATGTEEAAAPDEVPTLTVATHTGWAALLPPADNELPVYQELERLSGVHIEWENIQVANYAEVMRARLAAAVNLPDVINMSLLGDIGQHFPPSDDRWKGADSSEFVRHCDSLLRERGWRVGNTDITVICERPKVGPHALAMRERIGGLLQLPLDAVSVKATTSEKLGFTGRGEGIAAQAVVLLVAA